MILIDRRDDLWEMASLVTRQGISCEQASLQFADACFEGQGPQGLTAIGVERKKIGDMLQSIDTGRFNGHQRVGMAHDYGFSFLVIEGYWQPDTRTGNLIQGHPKPDGTLVWSPYQPGKRLVKYEKLRRYLFSLSLGGVIVLYTRDLSHTAYDICELYHYFQKPWREHKSLLAMHRGYFWQQDGRTDQLMALPTLASKPSLVRRWAAELPGIGVQKSEDVAHVFKSPLALAIAEEEDWLEIPGVGKTIAQNVIREIEGK